MLANYDYYCPHCDHKLTSDNQIHFSVRTQNDEIANLRLSAVPGKYGYQSDISLNIKNGEWVEFNCINCYNDLKSGNYPEFVEIHLKITDGVVFEVLFSPVCGEKITYVVMENEMVRYQDDFFSIIHNVRKTG